MKQKASNKKMSKKEIMMQIKKSIPDDIKILFGKFYVFSFFYIIFFFGLYPFWIVNKVSWGFSIVLFIILILFYGYMIRDVLKKKGNFLSTLFVVLILLVVMGISFSVIKTFL